MKKSITYLLTTLSIVLVSYTTLFSKSEEERYQGNTVVFNGKPLNQDTFWKGSKGKLALVKGNPNAKDSPKVPFRIYLKHDGKTINNGASSETREVYEVEVSPILVLARFGDELVIEPINKNDSPNKHIINLTKMDYMYLLLSPFFPKTKGNGC